MDFVNLLTKIRKPREEKPISKINYDFRNHGFQNIDNGIINSFLNYLESTEKFTRLIERDGLTFSNIGIKTYSSGIGVLYRNSKIGEELMCGSDYFETTPHKFYVKIFNNEDDLAREKRIISYFQSERRNTLSSQRLPQIVAPKEGESYVSIGEYHFMILRDAKHSLAHSNFLNTRENRMYEYLMKFPELRDKDEEMYHRMFSLAAYHHESKELISEDIFSSRRSKRRNDLEKRIQIISSKDLDLYEEIMEKSYHHEKRVLSHNDTKDDNFVEDQLIDFSLSSAGTEYADVEKALFHIDPNLRKRFREQYYKYRREISDNEPNPLQDNQQQEFNFNFETFNQRCIERGFTESLSLLDWYFKQNNEEKKNETLMNIQYYLGLLQK